MESFNLLKNTLIYNYKLSWVNTKCFFFFSRKPDLMAFGSVESSAFNCICNATSINLVFFHCFSPPNKSNTLHYQTINSITVA